MNDFIPTLEPAPKFAQHCLVEIMGHQKYAGFVTEEVIAGSAFVRVDVPEVPARPARGYYGAKTIS